MTEEKKRAVYGVVIAALFFLSWLAFCGVMLMTCLSYGTAGWAIFCFGGFLLWNVLLVMAVRRSVVLVVMIFLVSAAFLAFHVYIESGTRVTYRDFACRTKMEERPRMDRIFDVSGIRDYLPDEVEYFMCSMSHRNWIFHCHVEVPVPGAEAHCYAVSHVISPFEVSFDRSWSTSLAESEWGEILVGLCPYETWKKDVAVPMFHAESGWPYYRDRTVVVIYTPREPVPEWYGGYDAKIENYLRFLNRDELENYPLSAAGFAACVDAAADADAFYRAVKETSEKEKAAYDRYISLRWWARIGTGSLTYFFLLLIMVRMIRRKTYQPQA